MKGSKTPRRSEADQLNDLELENQGLRQELAKMALLEVELRRLKDFHENLINSMSEGIVLQDAEGVIEFVNPSAATLLGYRPDELVGESGFRFIPPDQHHIIRAADERRAQGKSDRYQVQVMTKDGRCVPVQISGSPQMDPTTNQLTGMLAVFTDISERVQAERALWESEERWRSIVQNTQALLVNVDTAGRLTYANEQAAKQLGYQAEQLIGRFYLRYIHPEDRERVMTAYLKQVAEGHQSVVQEYRVVTAAGDTRWLSCVTNPRLEGDQVVGITGVGLDITDRIEAENEREELLTAEREQRLLAETLREVTLALTSQTDYAAVLDEILLQAQRMVGSTAADITLLQDGCLHIVRSMGYDKLNTTDLITDLVHPLQDLAVEREAVDNRAPLIVLDTLQDERWVWLEGSRWIRSHMIVPINLQDKVLGLLRMNSDLPGQFTRADIERMQPLANAAAIAIGNIRLVEGLEAEVMARTAEIRDEKDRIEIILGSIRDAICMVGMDQRISYINSAFANLTGYSLEEAVGQYPTIFLAKRMPEQAWRSLIVALRQGTVWQGETMVRRSDGRTYEAAVAVTPVRDMDGNLTGYVSSHEDITQRKLLDSVRSRFMTNISHQLRTPVTNIKLYADLLQRGMPPENTARYIRVLNEQSDRLNHLIQDVLEITTLDSGQAVERWDPIDLEGLEGDVLERHADQAAEAGVDLEGCLVPAGLPEVRGDRKRLTQALSEVIDNAITFTASQSGSGHVALQIGTQQDTDGEWVTIAVYDDGPGIPEEEQDRIFERFYRGSVTDAGHIPGTGLGLSIAREIALAHAGRLVVQSPPPDKEGHGGSVFTFWLPIVVN